MHRFGILNKNTYFLGGFSKLTFILELNFFIRCHFKYKFFTLVVFLIALAYRVKGNDSR